MKNRKILFITFLFLYGFIGESNGANLVRNASMELDTAWNGTMMRQGSEFYQSHAQRGGALFQTPTGVEGWWVQGGILDGVEITTQESHTGKRSLKVGKPAVVISPYDRKVTKGFYTLSCWVKTVSAQGKVELEYNNGWRPTFEGGPQLFRQAAVLPANSGWTRLAVTAECPYALEAQARLTVTAGTVYLDDVQIEPGKTASAFEIRPEERLRVEFAEGDKKVLPKWIEKDETVRKISVYNDSRLPLTGKAVVFVGPWNKPEEQKIGEFDVSDVKPDQPRSFTFTTGKFQPDAYVVCVKYGDRLDGGKEFNPKEPSGGCVSNSQMSSRMVGRFLIAPGRAAGKIFGVGNGMLPFGGSWFSGYMIGDYVEARELGVVCSRGPYHDDVCYLTAVAGIPIHAMTGPIDADAPAGSAFGNPADPAYIDIYHPQGKEFFIHKAEQMGREFGVNPMVVSHQMANEKQYIHNGGLCPSTYADTSFREWCRRRHGDLKTLNERWKTRYTDWNQVEQIVSARFVEEEKNRPKLKGAAAIDWTAAARALGEPVVKRMQENPGRALDWLRWRTWSTLWMYSTFREHAKKFDTKTLYSTNLPWPNFWPQMYMPFIRTMDVTMVDFQYTSGWPKSLGTPQEMIDIAEMSESVGGSEKPFWGIEIYVQPSWPGEYAGMQNWAMVAHGVSNNLVFGWKPYSDVGPVNGTRAWEKADAPPMWFIIDTDGTKLPAYHNYRRTVKEIANYHARYDGLMIKRITTDIALYVSADTAEYVVYETGNKPWGSFWTRTRNNLAYVLRMSGIVVDYVDDATLPDKPGRFKTLIVPASLLLNSGAAEKIASFAKQGGTVVLAGVSGIYDAWLNRNSGLGGAAWSELNWQALEFGTDYADVYFGTDVQAGEKKPTAAERPGTVGGKIDEGINESKTFRGTKIGTMAGGEAIRDSRGTTVGWQRKWGLGRVIAYGVFPDTYVTNPHPSVNMMYWIQQVIDRAGLPFVGRWTSKGKLSTAGHLGTGNPVVEVVVREKSFGEKFVFCFNQGGSGEGMVEVAVPAGNWKAEDVISGKSITGGKITSGTWQMPLRLEAWGYRVLRLTRYE